MCAPSVLNELLQLLIVIQHVSVPAPPTTSRLDVRQWPRMATDVSLRKVSSSASIFRCKIGVQEFKDILLSEERLDAVLTVSIYSVEILAERLQPELPTPGFALNQHPVP